MTAFQEFLKKWFYACMVVGTTFFAGFYVILWHALMALWSCTRQRYNMEDEEHPCELNMDEEFVDLYPDEAEVGGQQLGGNGGPDDMRERETYDLQGSPNDDFAFDNHDQQRADNNSRETRRVGGSERNGRNVVRNFRSSDDQDSYCSNEWENLDNMQRAGSAAINNNGEQLPPVAVVVEDGPEEHAANENQRGRADSWMNNYIE